MARLIDPLSHLSNKDTGVPPVPPEAHQKAKFLSKRFVVAVELMEVLKTGDDHGESAAMQSFLEAFVSYELEGVGFWTWGNLIPMARCEVCHQSRNCIEAVWNYQEENDEQGCI